MGSIPNWVIPKIVESGTHCLAAWRSVFRVPNRGLDPLVIPRGWGDRCPPRPQGTTGQMQGDNYHILRDVTITRTAALTLTLTGTRLGVQAGAILPLCILTSGRVALERKCFSHCSVKTVSSGNAGKACWKLARTYRSARLLSFPLWFTSMRELRNRAIRLLQNRRPASEGSRDL